MRPVLIGALAATGILIGILIHATAPSWHAMAGVCLGIIASLLAEALEK